MINDPLIPANSDDKHNRKAQIDNVSFVTTEHQFVRSIVAKFLDAGVPVHFVSEHAVYEKRGPDRGPPMLSKRRWKTLNIHRGFTVFTL